MLPKRDPLSVVPREPGELAAFLTAAAAKQLPEAPQSVVRQAFALDAVTFLRDARTPQELRVALIDVLLARPGTAARRRRASPPTARAAIPPSS